MKFRGFIYDRLVVSLLAGFTVVFIVMTALLEPLLALGESVIALLIFGIAVYRMVSAKVRYKRNITNLVKKLDYTDTGVLSSLPFPVTVCDSRGYIIWSNGVFITDISGGEMTNSMNIETYTNGVSVDTLIRKKGIDVFAKDKFYSLYTVSYKQKGTDYTVVYYLDITNLKKIEIDYFKSRPYAILIELDNLDGSRSDFRDSERAEIKSRIEATMDDWADSYGSTLKKISDDRYFIFTEQKNMNSMIEDRFSILEKVRNFEYKEKKIGATLSVGISSGESFTDCDRNARKALEMALGRGGDQVAIKKTDGYDFIGGVSKSAEKRNKVRSRQMGKAIAELIKSSSNVIVMGHSYTDLDAIGAAVGIACAASGLGVPAYIATDRNKTLADSLIKKLDREDRGEMFISEGKAVDVADKNTLLVIVDTHIASFVEFPKLYEKISKKVIIDHHRRAANDNNDALIFHHDPGASSASEMVTELLQYMGNDVIVTKPVADALLAGIMLDTKNFVLRSGVKTFEAAAFLKDKGADTVSVKKLFSNSMEVSRYRNRVISKAESYKGCALSSVDFESPDVRIIAAQAADELLNVTGVKASFVMFANNTGVNISARSLGEINVQLVMESLGGGGHQTMAACQLKNTDAAGAKIALQQAIDTYLVQNSKH